MGLYGINVSYYIGTLCGHKSLETTELILLKFCRIVSHHLLLIISFFHFDSTNFTGVKGLYRINAYHNIGTLCGHISLKPLNELC